MLTAEDRTGQHTLPEADLGSDPIIHRILRRRESSLFREAYAAGGPEIEERTAKCFCCGRTFFYPEALDRFEAFIEERNGDFFAMDTFKDDICGDCAVRTLKNSTWMEIL